MADYNSAVPVRDNGDSLTVDALALDIRALTSSDIVTIDNLTSNTDDDSIAGGASVNTAVGLNYGWGGSAWERLNTDANGSLKVAVVSQASAPPNVFNAYLSETNLAVGAANRVLKEYDPAGSPSYFNDLWASASGKIKVDVYIYTAASVLATVEASGTKVVTGFNSTANPNIPKTWENDITVADGDSIYLVLTNLDNQAQNVYASVGGWY